MLRASNAPQQQTARTLVKGFIDVLTLDGDQLPLCSLLIPMEAVRVYLIFQTFIHVKTLFHSFVAFLVPCIFAFYFYAALIAAV